MRFGFFDTILETHVPAALSRALARRGHEIVESGPVWSGHRLPAEDADRSRVRRQLDALLEREIDVMLAFRPSALHAAEIDRVREAGVLAWAWFADDPVLYDVCYRHVVDAYDLVLHAGGERILAFYDERHGPTGVSFPFWAGSEDFHGLYDPAGAAHDVVFLGNCRGPVRRGRYELISSLPFRARIHGRVEDGVNGEVCGPYLTATDEIATALTDARLGLTIPQVFDTYSGHAYDFPELCALGSFDLPSRVVQYAAVGLPVLAMGEAMPWFPEAVVATDREALVSTGRDLLGDHGALRDLSERTERRFHEWFSGDARAACLEALATDRDAWQGLTLQERAWMWAKSNDPGYTRTAGRSGPWPRARLSAPRTGKSLGVPNERRPMTTVRTRHQPPVDAPLPSVEDQRAGLRQTRLESPNRYRILHFGAFANGETDIVASLLRALEHLGHTVLHVDTKRTKPNLARNLLDYSEGRPGGFGPIYIHLDKIEPLLESFDPQVIVCNAGGLCFRPDDAEELKSRGYLLLGVTLSDPDVFPSVSGFAGTFDYHTTNSEHALSLYEEAGIPNTFYFPFGIDRDYILRDVPPAPELEADVICLGHATNRPERNATMKALAEDFHVRVYGTGWELPDAEPVQGIRQIQASRAGRVHVNFAKTRADYVNVKCGVFETVGSGRVLCTWRFPEMERFFEYGSEIIGYESETDLAPRLRELFSQPEKLETIRRRSFARLVSSHLYEHRWLSLFEQIERDLASDSPVVGPQRAAVLRERLEPRPPRRTVVISGFYGARNTGDELLLKAITSRVREVDPDIEFVVAGVNAANVMAVHGMPSFKRTDLETAERVAAGASAMVLGGGGLWHDYTWEKAGRLKGLFEAPLVSVTSLGVLPLMMKVHRRPFHVVGMGVGPLTDEDARSFVRYLGEQASTISVRDQDSRQLLRSIDGWRKPVRVAPDPVFGLDLGTPEVPGPVRELAQSHRILGVNLRPWSGAQQPEMLDRLAEALRAVIASENVALLGIPMQAGDTMDRKVLTEVFDRVEADTPKVILEWTSDWQELYGALFAAEAVVSMRLHSCLLAHRLGTPAVGISYDPKVSQLFADLGVGHLGLPVDASVSDFTGALREVMSCQGMLNDKVRGRLAKLEAKAAEDLKRLGRELAKSQPTERPIRSLGSLYATWLA